eukprot:scaffold42465_cov36-Phaeocystis_antarctica.AAC.2
MAAKSDPALSVVTCALRIRCSISFSVNALGKRASTGARPSAPSSVAVTYRTTWEYSGFATVG